MPRPNEQRDADTSSYGGDWYSRDLDTMRRSANVVAVLWSGVALAALIACGLVALVAWLRGDQPAQPKAEPPYLAPDDADDESASSLEPALHETRDVSLSTGLGFAIGLSILIVVALTIAVTLQVVTTQRWPSLRPAPIGLDNSNVSLPPAPRLESAPGQTLSDLHTAEEAQLHSYGWVDQNAGVVHIPIERAVELLLVRGLPTRPEAESPPTSVAPSDANSGQGGGP